jgi:Flp pilus assembly protein TadD
MKLSTLKKLTPTLIAISAVCFYFFNHNKKVESQKLLDEAKEHYKIGHLDSAKLAMLKYSKQNELTSNALSFLGTIYLETSNLDSSKIAYNKSLKLNSQNFKSLTGLGIISRLSKDYEGAKEYYIKALTVKPNDPNALSSLAIIYLKQGEFQKAVNTGEKAMLTKPIRQGIKGNLAIAYHFNKQLNKRDKLLHELQNEGYSKLGNLRLIINGTISLEDF